MTFRRPADHELDPGFVPVDPDMQRLLLYLLPPALPAFGVALVW